MTTVPPQPPPPEFPAGWYNDGAGNQRYWDGQAWSTHLVDPIGPPPAPGRPAWPRVLGWTLALSVVLIVGTIVVTHGVLTSQADAARDAAEETVLSLNSAVTYRDCDAMFAATTARLRTGLNITTCESFTDYVVGWINPHDLYAMEIDDVVVSAGQRRAVVETTQTKFLEGGALNPHGTYELVKVDGSWQVDSIPVGGPFVGTFPYGG